MITNDMLEEAANRYGFNLEYKTSKILKELGYFTQQNKLMLFNNECIEVDVYATKKVLPTHILIECKGAEKETVLILMAAPSNIREDCTKPKTVTRFDIKNSNYKIPIYELNPENSPIFTLSGDFFKIKNGKSLGKASKDDNKNNFFKAQLQLQKAIGGLVSRVAAQDERDYIIPLIVTNAQIWVIDYEKEKAEICKHKWVLQGMVVDQSIIPLENEPPVRLNVPVVKIEYLEEFLDSIDKQRTDSQIALTWGMIAESET